MNGGGGGGGGVVWTVVFRVLFFFFLPIVQTYITLTLNSTFCLSCKYKIIISYCNTTDN